MKKKDIEIIDRIENSKKNLINEMEDKKAKYFKLKEELLSLVKDDIYNKIQTAKILKEINEKKYWIFEDGCKNFSSYLEKFNLAKSQVYKYFTLLLGIEKGVIDIPLIKNEGIQKCLEILQKKEITSSKINLNRPFRIQVINEEVYNFFQQDIKFIGFLLTDLFLNRKNEIEVSLEKYREKKSKNNK